MFCCECAHADSIVPAVSIIPASTGLLLCQAFVLGSFERNRRLSSCEGLQLVSAASNPSSIPSTRPEEPQALTTETSQRRRRKPAVTVESKKVEHWLRSSGASEAYDIHPEPSSVLLTESSYTVSEPPPSDTADDEAFCGCRRLQTAKEVPVTDEMLEEYFMLQGTPTNVRVSTTTLNCPA